MSNNRKIKDPEVLESVRSREIVSEILNFGVTQYQIKKIIKFLSLELEDLKLMRDISSLMEEEEDEVKPRIQL